jgi:hypothetical protein
MRATGITAPFLVKWRPSLSFVGCLGLASSAR